MRHYEYYDLVRNRRMVVPETALSNVAFCDLARVAWRTLRHHLALPVVEPHLLWAEREDGEAVGHCVEDSNGVHVYTAQPHLLIEAATTPAGTIGRIAALGHAIAALRPLAFGRLLVPTGMYWAAQLVSEVPGDSFALRVLHTYSDGQPAGWVTRLDVLVAGDRRR